MKRLLFVMALLMSFSLFSQVNIYPVVDEYHTTQEYIDKLHEYKENYPDIADFFIIGHTSNEYKPIYCLKISDNVMEDEAEPRFLYCGPHHAEEATGTEIVMKIADTLITNYDSNSFIQEVVNSNEIYIIPDVNIEGKDIFMAGEWNLKRKNNTDSNENGVFDLYLDGVDPNKNYAFNWEPDESTDPEGDTYKGPYPFSEAETRTIAQFGAEKQFQFAIFYHSSSGGGLSERIFYPWAWTYQGTYSPDYFEMQAIAQEFSARLPKDYSAGNYRWDVNRTSKRGVARAYYYSQFGTLAFIFETCGNVNEDEGCIHPGAQVLCELTKKHANAAMYLHQRAQVMGIMGYVTDAQTGEPLVAEVKVTNNNNEYLEPRMTRENGLYYRYLLDDHTYTVQFIKDGYSTEEYWNVSVDENGLTELNVEMTRSSYTDIGVDYIFNENNASEIMYMNPEFPVTARISNHGTATQNNVATTLTIYDESGAQIAAHDMTVPHLEANAWADITFPNFVADVTGEYTFRLSYVNEDENVSNDIVENTLIVPELSQSLYLLGYNGGSTPDSMEILPPNTEIAVHYNLHDDTGSYTLDNIEFQGQVLFGENPQYEINIYDGSFDNIVYSTTADTDGTVELDELAVGGEFYIGIKNISTDTFVGLMTSTNKKSRRQYFMDSCWRYSPEMYNIRLTANLVDPSDINEGNGISKPKLYTMHQNTPNPFNPVTTIRLNIPENTENASLKIFNIKGQVVKEYNLNGESGRYSLLWDGINDQNKAVSSGIYFYSLFVEDDLKITKKMIMLK